MSTTSANKPSFTQSAKSTQRASTSTKNGYEKITKGYFKRHHSERDSTSYVLGYN